MRSNKGGVNSRASSSLYAPGPRRNQPKNFRKQSKRRPTPSQDLQQVPTSEEEDDVDQTSFDRHSGPEYGQQRQQFQSNVKSFNEERVGAGVKEKFMTSTTTSSSWRNNATPIFNPQTSREQTQSQFTSSKRLPYGQV